MLVVDDDADTRELLHRDAGGVWGERYGRPSAAEAMAFVAVQPPDILLSDIGMPGEDGLTFIRRLRALPVEQGGSIPAAAITAYARAEDRAQALDAGFQLHLAKPIDPDEVIAAVSTLRKLCLSASPR